MKKLNAGEMKEREFSHEKNKPGTWFLVPIAKGVFVSGLIARRSTRGVLFGYFFRPPVKSPSELILQPLPRPDKCMLCGRFSDVGLRSGTWPIAYYDSNFARDLWPMPPFVRKDDATGIVTISEYDPDTFQCIKEYKGSDQELALLPYDRMMGHLAVIKRLKNLLDAERVSG